jgi:hypothetical protein
MDKTNAAKKKQSFTYDQFDMINGEHPLKEGCPDSYIEYEARTRKGGKVVYFNFDLAREMGLIPQHHPDELNDELCEKFLETFSLIIINEFDQLHNKKFPKNEIRPNKYMATKYLQLQHPNKLGKTSGDGRSIWNGAFQGGAKIWDISSCGTGATRLSPATAIKNKFFESGDPTISYGCGYSETDEGISTLIFSEVFHKNRIKTERVLGVIEFSKGISINIRVHENLLRPSHFFCHLKQSNLDALKNLTNYYIDRQERNGPWSSIPKRATDRYLYFLKKQIEVFARLSAIFEDEYIFCWLDWDGDNILMDGSVIDYGSVRQFGLFHHEYRYDDVDRYSTTILEQKQKAKYIVQCFAQMVDFLINGTKRPLSDFSKGEWSDTFEDIYKEQKSWNLVYKIGFHEDDCDYLVKSFSEGIQAFSKPYCYFERAKSGEGITEVEDGINWSAIYCMRDILREFPQILLAREEGLEFDEFIEIIKSNYATDEDLKPSRYRNDMIAQFQTSYIELVNRNAKRKGQGVKKTLLDISLRSSVINKYDRVTGDSITTVVDKILSVKPRLDALSIHQTMKDFVRYQDRNPETLFKRDQKDHPSKLMRELFKIVRDYREGL